MTEAAVRHDAATGAGDRRGEGSPRRSGEGGHGAMAACLAALLVAAFALAVVSLVTHAKADPTFSLDDTKAWRSGEAMHAVDRAIDVPYAAAVRRASAAVRYRVLGDLGPQVREGCPGWLFYEDGLRPRPSPLTQLPVDTAMQEQVAAMRRYAAALRSEGITLVVATVPDKARVETESLCGLHQDARMTATWDAWHSALAREGVVQVDLLGPLTNARPSFYRTDVHWNARGAQAAADAVAAAVLPHVGGHGDVRFTVEHETGVQPRVGDLLHLAGLANVPDGWRPPVDVEMPETIRPEQSGGLLDDTPPAQVLLAGSSFSRRSGFADRLGRALGREVWNVSVDDGRFDRAFASIWAKRATWPRSLRVVIWEMSEDALSELPTDASGPVTAGADAKARD
ncbi:alginate O-acetyltransferase AlgX-related protein [Trinickia dinghuensis]|uniref:Cell division protein FtsQ n=1 Tax=Trinickia dinghuensis TaxID=2291023 RepID=A0A3D8JZ20_9BURK|nr:cell division protein FtsQ [Trinickia dinghuensis]RDU98413.1 cell division protein FtsQ [Trinickia dinghuensis]